MDMKQTAAENPVLAILRNIPTDKLLDYAGAIIEGGVNFFEVALNSTDSLNQISLLKKHFGGRIILGAGTAINIDRASKAIAAGAEFLLSPSTDEDVLKYCMENNISFLPGALTPSDVSKCVRYGFNVIKFFPAGDMNRGYIKSLKGPFDDTDYIAIGGVKLDNAADFFRQGYIGVGIGSAIIPKEYVLKNAWTKASEYVEKIVKSVKGC